jgi:EF-P beta-lysylation protein EpmB
VTALAESAPVTLLPTRTVESWQTQLQNAIRDPAELAQLLDLDLSELSYSARADHDFELLVPHAFARRMRRGDPHDPLLLQVLPAVQEEDLPPGFGIDPVGELRLGSHDSGVLTKYSGRALLIATGQCAVNCRYCFRRHYPYEDGAMSSAERRQRIRALADDASVKELILSGGDPLLLNDRQIAAVADEVSAATHMTTLRIHTRLPVVIPERVTDELIAALTRPAMQCVVVLHCNHAQEIDATTASAIRRLRAAGITVLNQAVLLAGVNDSAEALAELSDALFAAGALPYYLHILDKVAGAAHFDVPQTLARHLVGALAGMRPGYLVPRLVVEVAGASSKRELAPLYPAHRQ